MGLDIVFPRPCNSNACISAFKTAVPVLFNIPIPLVAPAADEVKSVTDPSPPARLPVVVPVSYTHLTLPTILLV